TLYYIIVILTSVMFAGLAQNSRTPFFFNLYLFLSFLVLFFTYGFRNFSAIDDSSYINIFNSVSEIGWYDYFLNSTMEPGYLILNKFVNLFTNDYLFMQLTTSFIPLFLFYLGFKRYKDMISMPIAVFSLCTMLYFQMLSVVLIRMFIAISIVFIAFYYISKRKTIQYILLIFLASMFHYSSLSLIILILFITTPFIFIFIAKYIVPMLGSRYSAYGSIESIDVNISTFTTVPLLLFLLFFYKKFTGEKQLYFKLFLMVYALSIVISLFGGMIGLGRLIFYSYTFFILAVAMVGKLLIRNSKKLL